MGTAPGSKRLMDVEDVVAWACGELAKKRRGGGPEPLARLSAIYGRSAATVCGPWTWPAGFPEISPMFSKGFATPVAAGRGGEPHPDALIVEAAIGELADRIGMLAGAIGEEGEKIVADGIGLRIDPRGALDAALGNVANLTLVHGRMRNRPAWSPGAFAIDPVLGANGKPGVWRIERLMEPGLEEARDYTNPVEIPARAMRKDVYPPGSFCRIVYEPDPQAIANGRGEYLAWRLALDALAEALAGRMETLSALPAAAAVAPWMGDRDGDKPRALFAAGAERVFSAAEARAMAARRDAGERRPITAGRGGQRRRPAKPARMQGAG